MFRAKTCYIVYGAAPESSGHVSQWCCMQFSVILPVFNRAHSVGAALQSVLDQTRLADEVIVVDDGSTDDLMTVLAPFLDRIILHRQANAGAAAARNAGCARATGDWLTFQDSDDLWELDHLAVAERDLAITAPETVAHLADVTFVGPGYQQSLFALKGQQFPQEAGLRVDDPLLLVLSGMSLQGAAIRRDIFEKLGGLDISMRIYEDTAFFCQLALEGPFVVTGRSVTSAQRLDETTSALSGLERTETLYALQMQARVFEKLLKKDLRPWQLALVKRKLSGAQFSLARVIARTDLAKSRTVLRQSAQYHPSPLIGWTKAVIAGVLGEPGYRLVMGRGRGFDRK